MSTSHISIAERTEFISITLIPFKLHFITDWKQSTRNFLLIWSEWNEKFVINFGWLHPSSPDFIAHKRNLINAVLCNVVRAVYITAELHVQLCKFGNRYKHDVVLTILKGNLTATVKTPPVNVIKTLLYL